MSEKDRERERESEMLHMVRLLKLLGLQFVIGLCCVLMKCYFADDLVLWFEVNIKH